MSEKNETANEGGDELAAQLADLEAQLALVNKKNKELIAEKQAAKQAEKAAEEAAESLKAETGSELDKANRQLAKLHKDLDAEKQRAETATKGLRDFRAESVIAQALASANVESQHVPMLTKAFKMDLQFDDAGEPIINDSPATDYLQTYFAKDGLGYTRAAQNGGGGATGSEGSKANPFAGQTFSMDRYSQLKKTDAQQAVAYATATGNASILD